MPVLAVHESHEAGTPVTTLDTRRADFFSIRLPDDRGRRGKQKCRVIDVGSGQIDDLEELCHEPEAAGGYFNERVDVDGYMDRP